MRQTQAFWVTNPPLSAKPIFVLFFLWNEAMVVEAVTHDPVPPQASTAQP